MPYKFLSGKYKKKLYSLKFPPLENIKKIWCARIFVMGEYKKNWFFYEAC